MLACQTMFRHIPASPLPGHNLTTVISGTLCDSDQDCLNDDRPCCVAGKYVLKCLLSPDVRQLATASADKTVKLWNLDGFTLERTLTGIPFYSQSVC